MAKQSAFTTVTLRRLPQGESLQIVISSDKALSILKSITSKKEIPALTADNTLTITPKVYGLSGTQATLSGAKWQWGQTADNLSDMPGSWYTGAGVLTLSSSPIGTQIDSTHVVTSAQPFIMKFTCKALLNNHTYDIAKTVTFNCAETSDNSYWGAIEASNGGVLDIDHTSTTLTPSLHIGTTEVDAKNYNVVWYKTKAGGDEKITGDVDGKWHLSGKELTVYQGGIDTSAHFEAHFYDTSGVELEAEGVNLKDLTDELQIVVEGSTEIESSKTATLTVKAYNSKTGTPISISQSNGDTVEVVATDSVRQRTLHADTVGIGYSTYSTGGSTYGCGTVTMQEQYYRVPFEDQQTKVSTGVFDWAICGDSADKDTLTTDPSKATQAEIALLIGATINF